MRLPSHTCALPLGPPGACTQWEIYDEYIRDLERQKFEETMKAKAGKWHADSVLLV
jgi:hypothetical protein